MSSYRSNAVVPLTLVFIVAPLICLRARGDDATSRTQIKLAAPDYAAPKSLADVCEAHEFALRRDGQTIQTFAYRLFKPLPNPTMQKYPLILWVHGYGDYELSKPNFGQLKGVGELVLTDLADLTAYPFYLVAMQCPKNCRWDSTYETSALGQSTFDTIDANIELIKSLMQEFPIDEKRIYAIGISSGGPACWQMVQRQPNLFAAAAPLACVLDMPTAPEAIAGVSIWSFRSLADTSPPMEDARLTIEQLHKLGQRCILTEVDTGIHDCWTTAFFDYYLLDWLLSQQRGCLNCPAPGSISVLTRLRLLYRICPGFVQWWPQFTVLIGAVAIYYVFQRERKRLISRSKID
jgi:predicted peptidase